MDSSTNKDLEQKKYEDKLFWLLNFENLFFKNFKTSWIDWNIYFR